MTKPNKPYGIIWSQNVPFVKSSSFNGNGILVSSRARFLLYIVSFSRLGGRGLGWGFG